MRYSVILFIPLFVPAQGFAQLVSFGVKGGVPATDAFKTARAAGNGYVSGTKRYVAGGTFEVRLPAGIGVELDALYRRLNYEASGTDGSTSTSGNSWEFPLLFKLRAVEPSIRPFLVAGPSFRHVSGLKQFLVDPLGRRRDTADPPELQNRFSTGFTAGVGLEIGNRFRLVPEVRYTRWGWENFQSAAIPRFRSNLNQLDVLLGIHF